MKMNMFLRHCCITVLFLLALPAIVHAQFTVFTNNPGSLTPDVTITGYNGPGGIVMIPDYFTNYYNNVTNYDAIIAIGTNAFANCTNLTAIAIPECVTSIGALAFSNCINLKAAYFSSNAPPDAGTAFYGDTNAVVYYLSGTTGWGPTFGGAPTMAETQPSEIEYAQSGPNLFNVTITAWAGTNRAVVIPATINYDPYSTLFVTSIGGESENPWTGVTSIIIPYTVTNIANSAFEYGTFITNIIIPNSVTSIAEYTFNLCTKLTSVTIPNSVTSIGSDAFLGCRSLTSVSIPGSVTNIGVEAFQSCASLAFVYFQGNAPPDPGIAFSGGPTIVYYQFGTTGWGPTWGGVPAVLWNPQATAFTMAGGQFGFNITGPTNTTIVVESCTNLVNPVWLPVSTNTLSSSGTSPFSDPQGINAQTRYYRFSAP